MTIASGPAIDDLILQRPDGTSVRLSEIAGRPLLVIFLRHLA